MLLRQLSPDEYLFVRLLSASFTPLMVVKACRRGRRCARGSTQEVPTRRSPRLRQRQINRCHPSLREVSRSSLTGSRQEARIHQASIENV